MLPGMEMGKKGSRRRVIRIGKEIRREGLLGHVLVERGLDSVKDECEWVWVVINEGK
jgi:hypothetical protein